MLLESNFKKLKKNQLINSKYFPYIKYNLLKKFFKKKKLKTEVKVFKIFQGSIRIFNFFKKKNIFIFVYNGKKFINFYYSKLKICLLIGEFITTRVVNSGHLLHKRKKK